MFACKDREEEGRGYQICARGSKLGLEGTECVNVLCCIEGRRAGRSLSSGNDKSVP
jgi:hypothetical protein